MSTIGKNRLAIYDLFYRYPPCDYIYNKKLNVLIIGNGWVGNEAFKAMFWDGQYPGVDLNITIASNNVKQYEEALKEKLPGLGDFADFNGNRTSKYHYANIDIRDVSFDEIKETGITDAMAAEDCMNLQNQNIIVVSVGASEINGLLGVIISDLIKDNPQRVLLAVYGSEEISAPSNVEYVSFSSEVDIDTSELMKLAANINYVYDAKYNNFTINRKHSIEKYLAKYKKEFEETPEDTGDIFISLTNFTGMDYTADSSLAQAVHMPMKLDYCFHGGTAVEMTAELVKIINEHGKKFNLLAALEHKRWCAYMAIRACRMPKRDELGYLYSNGNNHKDDKNNLHICMCECGQNGATLDRASRRWGERVPDEMGKFKARFSKIMINGMLSYFMVNAHLFEISGVIKERLDVIFEEYGIKIQYFNVETIEVPEADYKKVSEAKERRTSRMIEGYSWAEERQMIIAEKFASNEGTMGNIGGAVGGFMMGGAMGGSIVDIARSALEPERIPKTTPPKDAAGTHAYPGQAPSQVNVNDFFKPKDEETAPETGENRCPNCGTKLPPDGKFCLECGKSIQHDDNMIVCPSCGKTVHKGKFCSACGHEFSANTCPYCGTTLPEGAKFCFNCGKSL